MPEVDEDGGREDHSLDYMDPPDQGQSIPAVGESASQSKPAFTAVGEDGVRGGHSPSVPYHKYPLLLFHNIESMPALGEDGDSEGSPGDLMLSNDGEKEIKEKKRSKVEKKGKDRGIKAKSFGREPKEKTSTSRDEEAGERHESSSRDRSSTDKEKPRDTSQEGSRHMMKQRGKGEKKEKLNGEKETMKTKNKKRERNDSEERDDE